MADAAIWGVFCRLRLPARISAAMAHSHTHTHTLTHKAVGPKTHKILLHSCGVEIILKHI